MDNIPLLLLDVDGVLNPVGVSSPPGFRRIEVGGFAFSISELHRSELASLRQTFEIGWASTWEDAANESIGPALGLPRLRYIDLSGPRSGATWKMEPVRRFAGDRPLVWVDDELYSDAFEWSVSRGSPTLLVKPSSSVGLRSDHFEQIRGFAAKLR